MPFRFSLATLLRVRESLEHTEMLVLEKRYGEVAFVQGQLWEADQNLIRARECRQEELSRGVMAVQLQLALEEEIRQRRLRDELLKELQAAQTRLREQLDIYWKARQKRDVLQEIRKQKFEQYRREQEKSEQRERDELFLLRYRSKR
jgi:flagellar FliJ protein